MKQLDRTQRLIGLAVLVILLAAGGVALWRHLAQPEPLFLQLADGTEAYFLSDSKVMPAASYPQPREIKVNGDIFLRIAAAPQPLTLRSRLLVLTVTGETALRITAWAHETGEQVEVLHGHVVARKSYPSTYSEPDTLTAGQMVMINRTIDLMEKEKFEPAEVRTWSEQLMAAAKERLRERE